MIFLFGVTNLVISALLAAWVGMLSKNIDDLTKEMKRNVSPASIDRYRAATAERLAEMRGDACE